MAGMIDYKDFVGTIKANPKLPVTDRFTRRLTAACVVAVAVVALGILIHCL